MAEMIRNERCSCGGVIAVPLPATDDEIMRAVMAHQRTARHLIWRENGALEQRPAKLDAYEGRLA